MVVANRVPRAIENVGRTMPLTTGCSSSAESFPPSTGVARRTTCSSSSVNQDMLGNNAKAISGGNPAMPAKKYWNSSSSSTAFPSRSRLDTTAVRLNCQEAPTEPWGAPNCLR